MKQFFALCLITFAAAPAFALDAEAERYVRLALQLGEYDPDYVDAYLGPEEWAQSAKENLRSEAELSAEIAALFADLRAMSPDDPDSTNRHRALLKNVQAMDTRMRMVNGETFTFAEEARLIYDVVLPEFDFTEFDRAREEIDKLLPGEGDVSDRIAAFRDSLVIREEARDEVLNTAINECRRRSAQHISLPSSERFTLEYVTDRSWSGYNWYQGDNESLMQFNLDFPTKVSSAIGLGCHEGYPGHHVWNVLVENRLLNEKGWIEFYIFPLFSPGALIGEGSANYGVDLAFPGSEKTDYERNVLFPMAGVDPDKVATLDALNKLMKKLSFAQMATAQLYLDGAINREEAIEMRRKYGLSSRARAEQSVRFIEQYRSYVLNYSLGQEIVEAYVERHGDDPASRWKAFERMLTELHFASDMIDKDRNYLMNFDLAITRADADGVYGSIQPQAIAGAHNLEDAKMIILVSQIIVLVIGVTVIVLAGWGIFGPEKLMTFVTSAMDKYWGIYVAVIVRLVLGSALIIVAPASLFPIVFQVLGVIAIVAAIALVLMGRERIRRFIAWWSERFSAQIVRLWLLFGMAFGGFLVYGVL